MDQPIGNMRNVQVLGIDAGGTMTDTFFVDADDESIGLIASSEDGLANWGVSMVETLSQLETGVYSGTAMINRVVQRKGLKCGLILNRGMEDNHRMGRKLVEEVVAEEGIEAYWEIRLRGGRARPPGAAGAHQGDDHPPQVPPGRLRRCAVCP